MGLERHAARPAHWWLADHVVPCLFKALTCWSGGGWNSSTNAQSNRSVGSQIHTASAAIAADCERTNLIKRSNVARDRCDHPFRNPTGLTSPQFHAAPARADPGGGKEGGAGGAGRPQAHSLLCPLSCTSLGIGQMWPWLCGMSGQKDFNP